MPYYLRTKYGYKKYSVAYKATDKEFKKRLKGVRYQKKKVKKKRSLWFRDYRVTLFLNKLPTLKYEQRIEELIKLSSVKLYSSKSYYLRRKNKYKAYGICRLCGDRKAEIRHHMILIKNGGPDEGWNRINICNQCHENIHEWLKPGRMAGQMDQEYLKVTL